MNMCSYTHEECKKNYVCTKCNVYRKDHDLKVLTNADVIRSMSDEELTETLMKAQHDIAKVICKDFGTGCYYTCEHNKFCEKREEKKVTLIEWLQSESEE